MAELSTIARPYAQALFKAVATDGANAAATLAVLDDLAVICSDKNVAELATNPKVTSEQLFEVISGVLPKMPEVVQNFLHVAIENGRLSAAAEIARQFRDLKNESEGVSEALIESAFPMDDAETASLVEALGRRFPGKTLKAQVQINKDLMAGVRVVVGDRVLDASLKARLAQMQAALTA